MATDKLLLPSMMCADFGSLAGEVAALEAAGADGFHLDLMDGNCSPERIAQASAMGVRGFVLGTAGLFGHGPYAETMAGLRGL